MTDQIITSLEQHSFYMLLFNLIFRHDDHLRLDVIEAIRKILQNPIPDSPLTPTVGELLQQMRDGLLAPPQSGIVSELPRPPVQLVEKHEKKT